MAGFRHIKVHYKYDEDDTSIMDAVFAGIFRREALLDSILEGERVSNVGKFAAQFADNIFQDEYAILYELAVTRRLTTGAWDMFRAVIDENKQLILSAPQVNLKPYKGDFTESDEYDAFIMVTMATFNRICDLDFVGAEGFRSAISNFIEVFEKKYFRQSINVAALILNSPDVYIDYRGGRRREYFGFKGSTEFLTVEKMKIDALRSAQGARQFVVDSEWINEHLDPVLQAQKERKREKLCNIGIPEIDDVWSGIRRTQMIGVIGPPKGGKTTLSAYMVHCLLKAGCRVAVWAMEGSAEESWLNKLIAAQCFDMNVNVTTKDISDGLKGKTDDEKRAVVEARLALAQNNKLSFIEETGYVEDFIDVIDGHYRACNNFDVIVVDSLLNLQTKTGRKKSEYLSSAYIMLKDYIEHKLTPAPACITTAQFKQEAVKEARNSVDITFDETSGGETAETIRTPDNVIGVFGTPAQRDSGYTTIHHIASRHSELFKKVEVKAVFGNAMFYVEP